MNVINTRLVFMLQYGSVTWKNRGLIIIYIADYQIWYWLFFVDTLVKSNWIFFPKILIKMADIHCGVKDKGSRKSAKPKPNKTWVVPPPRNGKNFSPQLVCSTAQTKEKEEGNFVEWQWELWLSTWIYLLYTTTQWLHGSRGWQTVY